VNNSGYAEDVEPETPEQVAPLEFTGKLGYYTVGMQIDPLDWSNPGTHKIIRHLLKLESLAWQAVEQNSISMVVGYMNELIRLSDTLIQFWQKTMTHPYLNCSP